MFNKNATISWCENKYTHSSYIAEFYNSLTGIFLCCSPLLFYYNNSIKSNKFITCISKLNTVFFLLFLVGIGTILFHSTLLYVFQLLDELPMLLLCIEYYIVLDKLFTVNGYHKYKLTLLHINIRFKYILCTAIAISGYIHDNLQVYVFQYIITGYVVYLVYKLYTIYNDVLKIIYNLHLKKKELELAFVYDFSIGKKLSLFKKILQTISILKDELNYANKICIITGISSIVFWELDNRYCNTYLSGFGHAFWHILTSITLYYINKIILLLFIIRKHYTMMYM